MLLLLSVYAVLHDASVLSSQELTVVVMLLTPAVAVSVTLLHSKESSIPASVTSCLRC